MRRIETHDADGVVNGWLLPIWNGTTDAWRPEQVYLTAVAPCSAKGPHLHLRRHGRFICVRGDVRIRMRDAAGNYHTELSGDCSGHRLIDVPPGTAAQLINDTAREALVLNLPAPAWTPADQDEHPVEDWIDE